jgi:hypothetical protein
MNKNVDHDEMDSDWMFVHKNYLDDNYPHQLVLSLLPRRPVYVYTNSIHEMGVDYEHWCRCEHWKNGCMIFGFKYEDHLMAFKMRWGV